MPQSDQRFCNQFQHNASRVNQCLSNYFSHADSDISPLDEAIRYALLDAGKRLRANLVYATNATLRGPEASIDSLAMAIECIHAYSLIHDDLPDMDNDDLRRGKPSTHKAFDNATAILAGDALQAAAFEIISTAREINDNQKVSAVRWLSQAAGRGGMVGGQQIDINKPEASIAALARMHRLKTGALFRASCLMGTLVSRANSNQINYLANFGESLGLIFQIKDDLLDVQTQTNELGKNQGADLIAGKVTYVSLLGIDGAEKELRQRTAETKALLKKLSPDYNIGFLSWLVDLAISRRN